METQQKVKTVNAPGRGGIAQVPIRLINGKTLGEIAYCGYCEQRRGLDFQNRDLLPWESQTLEYQNAFEATGNAVAFAVSQHPITKDAA